MSDLIVYHEIERPPIPLQWDYEESVEKMRGNVYKMRFLDEESVKEVWVANQVLDGRGGDRGNQYTGGKVAKDKKLTFATYCEDIGITKQSAYNWFERWGLRSPKRLVGKFTGNAENYTPEAVIKDVKAVLGEIDLDPASCEEAQQIVQAKTYFTSEDDGLSKPWNGRVFLNPPYDAKTIKQFTNKLLSERDNIISAILLTNNNTDTSWFHNCARCADILCFTNGRIGFYTSEIEKTAPTNGQTFFYFGGNKNRFKEIFLTRGLLMEVVV